MPSAVSQSEAEARAAKKAVTLLEPYPGNADASVLAKCDVVDHPPYKTNLHHLSRKNKGNGCPTCKKLGLRLTAAEVADRLARRGVTAIGSYDDGNALTPLLVTCGVEGHEPYSIRLDNLPRGNACRACRGDRDLMKTVAKCHELAERRGDEITAHEFRIMPTGKRRVHVTVRWAHCKHETDNVDCSNYLAARTGCGYCANLRVLPGFNDLAHKAPEVAAQADGWDPTTVVWTSGKRMAWRCSDCGKGWETAVSMRTGQDTGCPTCAPHGYRPGEPGAIYVVSGVSAYTGVSLIKIGIANVARLEGRLTQHDRQGLNEVVSVFAWDDGSIPQAVERHWKEKVRRALPPEVKPKKVALPDGYTEAAVDHPESWAAVRIIESRAITMGGTMLSRMEVPVTPRAGHAANGANLRA